MPGFKFESLIVYKLVVKKTCSSMMKEQVFVRKLRCGFSVTDVLLYDYFFQFSLVAPR